MTLNILTHITADSIHFPIDMDQTAPCLHCLPTAIELMVKKSPCPLPSSTNGSSLTAQMDQARFKAGSCGKTIADSTPDKKG